MQVARASFPRGNLAMRIRDALGEVYSDSRFVAVFARSGRPAMSPGQLMMVTVLQFTENLTDRQAADAARDRVSWKYALGLELDDPGFDASVLSEFRSRLVTHDQTSAALDLLLDKLFALGLIAAGGKQRTDSTHVLARIRVLNRLELAGETVRAALEALAVAAPAWLTRQIGADWQTRYEARVDGWRLPASEAKRTALAVRYGADGYALLEAIHGGVDAGEVPGWLAELPAVEALRRIWIQQYYREVGIDGREVITRREASVHGLPPGLFRLISPYDLDARYSVKRDTRWAGYKVHVSERCDAGFDEDGRDLPHVITNVTTTQAAVPDQAMLESIHRQLAGRLGGGPEGKGLLPARHLLDSGYPSARLVVSSPADFGVELIAPLIVDHSAQAKAGARYDRSAFTIDWDNQRAICPQGKASASWNPSRQRAADAVVIAFAATDCGPCPVRNLCTSSKRGRRRLSVPPRDIHDAQTRARANHNSEAFKTEYAARAGVEATIHQAVAVTGTRQARYRGIHKTRLEHTIAAAAINLVRLDAYLTGKPLDRGRTSHLARLDFMAAA
ncbi:MAG TPA: IS1182 family transposase [Dactylosporangium sp.]|nr:IS1182 family transposase [Dactylosporangium sp.]